MWYYTINQFYLCDWGISCRTSTRPGSFAGVDDQRNQGIKQSRTGTRSGNYHFEGPSRESAEQITSDAKGTPVFSYPPKGFTFQTDYSSRRSIHYVISFVLFIFLWKAYEAKEDSFRRRIGTIGTGTGANVWPTLGDKNVVQRHRSEWFTPNNLQGCPNNNLFRHCVIWLFLL